MSKLMTVAPVALMQPILRQPGPLLSCWSEPPALSLLLRWVCCRRRPDDDRRADRSEGVVVALDPRKWAGKGGRGAKGARELDVRPAPVVVVEDEEDRLLLLLLLLVVAAAPSLLPLPLGNGGR